MSDYPKIKYKGAAAAVPYNADKPGFTAVKVNSAEEEQSLGDGYYDTPAEAIKAFAGTQGERDRTEIETLQARIKELEAQSAGSAGGAAAQTAHGGTSGEASEDPRKTGDWPSERKKR